MRILVFTPYVPYPPNSGGQTRTFNLIKHLSAKHEITSFSFLRVDKDEPDLKELRKYCQDVRVFRRKKAWASPGKILQTAVSPYPYLVNMYFDPKIRHAIRLELEKKHYDLIHVETYYILPNIPDTSVPVLLAEQTIEYQVYQHFMETTKLLPLKPFLGIDVLKHKYWEKYYWKKAKKVVAMSETDKKVMLSLVPNLNVDIVPNGIDRDWFREKIVSKKKAGPVFLFVGNFNWLQNIEAAEVLSKEIWPEIKKQLPDASLWIVGRDPKPGILRLERSGIKVSGDVEDIRTAYQSSDVLLAPMYGGGGTRYKTLEAMASHLPVVSTEIGVEGLGAVNEKHALISNNPKTLALLAVKVALDKELAKKLANNAYDLVSQNFDWQRISAKLNRIYEEAAKRD